MTKFNEDGKFFDRLLPGLVSATIAVVGFAIISWSDFKVKDTETDASITRLDREISALKVDMAEARRDAAADRSKTNDLAADVKVLLAITQRIEQTLARDGVSPPHIPINPR